MKILKTALLALFTLVLITTFLFGYQDIAVETLKEEYANAASAFVSINGMDVHYRNEGLKSDSVPIVLIHGTGSSLHTFDGWVSKLKAERRVLRMDLPGYGLTGPFPERDYSINNYVAFLKEFLDTLGIDKCIVGGNSLGGQIAWRFTTTHPSMVHKLVLIDAAGYPYKAQSSPLAFRVAKIPVLKELFTFITPKFIARSSVENVFADKSKVTDELANRYFDLTLREGNRRAFIDRFQAQNDPKAHQEISTIIQPTLILWGDQDRLIPVENAYRFHNDLPNDTLVILKNAGHVPMEELPLESVQVLTSFLRDQD